MEKRRKKGLQEAMIQLHRLALAFIKTTKTCSSRVALPSSQGVGVGEVKRRRQAEASRPPPTFQGGGAPPHNPEASAEGAPQRPKSMCHLSRGVRADGATRKRKLL